MSACNTEPCKSALNAAAEAKAAVDDIWDLVLAAVTAAGFTGGATGVVIAEGAIAAWIAAKTAEAVAAAAIPLLGWVFAVATVLLIAAAIALWARYMYLKSVLRNACANVRRNCSTECWPEYCK